VYPETTLQEAEMFGRDKRGEGAVAERDRTREVHDTDGDGGAGVASREGAGTVRARQRDEFGGFNWGSAFFGWLVAIGMAALLTGILSGAGAAIGLTETSGSEARDSAETISVVGAVLLLLVLGLAYYCGGYVAGRMSRFDGARQGLGVWLFGLLATIAIGLAGAIFGSEYNVLGKLDLPRIPIDEGDLATGGLIALALIILGTLLAAMFGGKVGERYHRKVDRVGFAGARD
jgi:VIT1/CCC1 family predicted Fe2+/Mn2+ transporter